MRIAVPREAAAGEGRVALVPETVGRLVADGFEVVVERGAGAAAGYPDEGYAEAGATLREAGGLLEGVDTIVRVARPTPDEVSAMAPGTMLIGFLSPLTDAEGIERLAPPGRRRVRDGVRAADLARPVDGRALLAGERRGLQGGADRRRPRAQALPDADDGGRHDRARRAS